MQIYLNYHIMTYFDLKGTVMTQYDFLDPRSAVVNLQIKFSAVHSAKKSLHARRKERDLHHRIGHGSLC